ncbi:hypothetical protein [Sphingomonas jeddahensis]|uniref:hypothetical protein n=1 Tax=Sphingomonas jeddahensis TaxID=1915074 RepID=UPI0009785312|nr:hypothetical protein [Sphingomonas jeddahensis]
MTCAATHDIVVVGDAPAGLAFVRALANSGFPVALGDLITGATVTSVITDGRANVTLADGRTTRAPLPICH